MKNLLKMPVAKEAPEKWPWYGPRRTFCTFHVAKYQSADRTALILRHRGVVATLLNAYMGRGITQGEGVEYFQIMPQPITSPIRPVAVLKGAVKRFAVQGRRPCVFSALCKGQRSAAAIAGLLRSCKRFGLSHDVLRHTFISMFVAKFRSMGEAALHAGNSESIIRKALPGLEERGGSRAVLRDSAEEVGRLRDSSGKVSAARAV